MIKILIFCLLLIVLFFILRYQSTKMKSTDNAIMLMLIDLVVTLLTSIITNFAYDSLKTVMYDINNVTLGDWGIILSCIVCIFVVVWRIKEHSMMYYKEYIPFIIVGVIIVLLSSMILISMVRNTTDRNTKIEQFEMKTEKQETQEEISTFSYIEELQDEQKYQKLVDDCKNAILSRNDYEAKEIINRLSIAKVEQQIIDDLKAYYLEQVLYIAAMEAEEGRYGTAYEYLCSYEQYFDNATLTERKNMYRRNEILRNIQYYEEQEDYESAIVCLKDNEDMVKNDPQFIQKQIDYAEILKKQVLFYIESLIIEQKYQEAIDYLGKYVELLDGDEDILNKMAELEILCPVKLNEVKIMNKYGSPILSGQGSDIWGNKYSDAILLSPQQGDGIEFFLGGEYRTLSFTVVLDERDVEESNILMCVYKPTGHTTWWKEKYFLKESIVYTDRPKEFNIDVSDVNFITIRLFVSGYDNESVLIIANAELKR